MKAQLVYKTSDWGTERMLHLIDENGNDLVPPRDPFWPNGIPVSEAARSRILRKVGLEMTDEFRKAKA